MSSVQTRESAFAQLVERQMRNWELARQQRQSRPEASPGAEVEDFISISRMVGVDAEPIATRLSRRLGWPLFDREILDEMSGSDFYRERVYASMDERDLSWFEQAVRGFVDHAYVKNDYFRQLCRTVLSLARQGNGLFLGRGTDLILPAGCGFRVRLVAPLDSRIEVLRRGGRSEAEARRELERVEREREEFFQHHFGIDARDPSRPDVAIHVERFTPDQAVDLILAARDIRSKSA